MRKALIVGINYYARGNLLYGCVDDALSVKGVLEKNGDKSANFECKTLVGKDVASPVSRDYLKDSVEELFCSDADVALFYFAGHGHIETSGGYILASDSDRGDRGVSLSDIMNYANDSPAKNKIIILDSCHSGIAGETPRSMESNLSEGLTVLAASTKDQYATESEGRGVFTLLLVDALNGGAANLVGDITPGSIYAHIDQSLGAWEQRPVFKTNVKQFVSLRKIPPLITIRDLKEIAVLFPYEGFELPLDPTFEPNVKGRDDDMPAPIDENVRIFNILQKYNRLNLLVPIGAEHMWNAAMESKACKLTRYGEHYRRLAAKNRI